MLELSLALGKTLQELRAMPARDYELYRQYYARQPFGQWRADYNAARIVQSAVGGRIDALMPFWFDDIPDDDGDFDALFAGAVSI